MYNLFISKPYCTLYLKFEGFNGKKESWLPTMTDEMLLAAFNRKYVLGFEDKDSTDDKTTLKTWFNAEAFHSGRFSDTSES